MSRENSLIKRILQTQLKLMKIQENVNNIANQSRQTGFRILPAKTELTVLTKFKRFDKEPAWRYFRDGYPLSTKKIGVASQLLDQLKAHAMKWKPAESCGMLFGKRGKGNFLICGAVLCSNPTHSPGYFEMPPEEIVKSYELARQEGYQIVGVFHSHPSGFETPSSTDRHYMTLTPGAWIIYSNKFRCFTLGSEINIEKIKVDTILYDISDINKTEDRRSSWIDDEDIPEEDKKVADRVVSQLFGVRDLPYY